MMHVIHISHRFYRESGTIMGQFYTLNGERMDFGLIERLLESGKSVYIRPAVPEELEKYEWKLQGIQSKLERDS